MASICLCAAAAAALVGASAPTAAPNLFALPSTLPFEAPPFDRITDTEYQPAMEEGMAKSLAEVRRIAGIKTLQHRSGSCQS